MPKQLEIGPNLTKAIETVAIAAAAVLVYKFIWR